MSHGFIGPDYSTLSWRQKTLAVPLVTASPREAIHVVVDSTGVKVFGDGEWKAQQHGLSKRRTWRKLHVAINEAIGEALAMKLTTNSVDDAAEVKPLLTQIATPIKAFGGDGGYDKTKVYSTLAARSRQQQTTIQINIPRARMPKLSSMRIRPSRQWRVTKTCARFVNTDGDVGKNNVAIIVAA